MLEKDSFVEDFAMTCSLSGLAISEGTPVRCLLLTASPYGNEDPRQTWIVRTPPLRAVYNGHGSIRDLHQEDAFIAALWLRGLHEDLIRGNLREDMSFDELLAALRTGSVLVRQDANHFWRRPLLDEGDDLKAQRGTSLSLQTVEEILSQDPTLENRLIVDEPIPDLVRVRFDRDQERETVLVVLGAARTAIERAGFVGVVTAGSDASSAELVVLTAPNGASPARGPSGTEPRESLPIQTRVSRSAWPWFGRMYGRASHDTPTRKQSPSTVLTVVRSPGTTRQDAAVPPNPLMANPSRSTPARRATPTAPCFPTLSITS